VDRQTVWVALLSGSETARSEGSFVTMLALPGAGVAGCGAGSVVVSGGGAKSFFFTVVAYEGEFDEGGEEEEDAGDVSFVNVYYRQ
jgi:hypothetical protein